MFVLEHANTEICGVRNVDAVIKAEISSGVDGPTAFRFSQMVCCNGIRRNGRKNVRMEFVKVKCGGGMEGRSIEESGMERCRQLCLGENQAEILQIDCSVVVIPPFGVDVPSSS